MFSNLYNKYINLCCYSYGRCDWWQQSPQRNDVFCEGLFLVLNASPHMGGTGELHQPHEQVPAGQHANGDCPQLKENIDQTNDVSCTPLDGVDCEAEGAKERRLIWRDFGPPKTPTLQLRILERVKKWHSNYYMFLCGCEQSNVIPCMHVLTFYKKWYSLWTQLKG